MQPQPSTGAETVLLSWKSTSEFFSLKTPSFLLPEFLTPSKIFLCYIKIPVKSLDSAAMTKTESKSVSKS